MRQALELALEALEYTTDLCRFLLKTESSIGPLLKADKAITAIKESLAQPEQEPVAWRWENKGEDKWLNKYIYLDNGAPDYPEECEPLYTTPPQRKPLTDEEIIASNYPDGEENGPTIAAPDFELICFARQIEAAHGIKE